MISRLLETDPQRFRAEANPFGSDGTGSPGPTGDKAKIAAIRSGLNMIKEPNYSGLVNRLRTILDQLEKRQIQSLPDLVDIARLARQISGEDQEALLAAIDAFEGLTIVQQGRDRLVTELSAAEPVTEEVSPLEPIKAFRKIINESQERIRQMSGSTAELLDIFRTENQALFALYVAADLVASDSDLVALMIMTKAKIIVNNAVIDYVKESDRGFSEQSFQASMKTFILSALYHSTVGTVHQLGKLDLAEAKSVGSMPSFTDVPERDQPKGLDLFSKVNNLNDAHKVTLFILSLLDYNAKLAKHHKERNIDVKAIKRNLEIDKVLFEAAGDVLTKARRSSGEELTALQTIVAQATEILNANIGLLEGRGTPLDIQPKLDRLKQLGLKHPHTSADFKEAFRCLDIDDLLMEIDPIGN